MVASKGNRVRLLVTKRLTERPVGLLVGSTGESRGKASGVKGAQNSWGVERR